MQQKDLKTIRVGLCPEWRCLSIAFFRGRGGIPLSYWHTGSGNLHTQPHIQYSIIGSYGIELSMWWRVSPHLCWLKRPSALPSAVIYDSPWSYSTVFVLQHRT